MKSTQFIKLPILFLILFSATLVFAQSEKITFDVFLKDKKIGQVIAEGHTTGAVIIHDIKSVTEANVMVFSIHVETDMKTEKNQEVMISGAAYRHSNRGLEDVHAETKRLTEKKYERMKNGKKSLFSSEITFTVSDLYFKEPIGLNTIYSNMYADMVSIEQLNNGKYKVKTSDAKESIYTYSNGKLTHVEFDTPVGKIISMRK